MANKNPCKAMFLLSTIVILLLQEGLKGGTSKNTQEYDIFELKCTGTSIPLKQD